MDCFQSGAIMNKTAMNSLDMSLFLKCTFSFVLGEYLGVELLGRCMFTSKAE